MRMIVLKNLVPRGFAGITLFPFVIARDGTLLKNTRFVNHERIHLHQQRELLLVFFFVWYLIEFFVRWIQYRNAREAYRNISFEREAYTNERNRDYVKNRKIFSFWNYL